MLKNHWACVLCEWCVCLYDLIWMLDVVLFHIFGQKTYHLLFFIHFFISLVITNKKQKLIRSTYGYSSPFRQFGLLMFCLKKNMTLSSVSLILFILFCFFLLHILFLTQHTHQGHTSYAIKKIMKIMKIIYLILCSAAIIWNIYV